MTQQSRASNVSPLPLDQYFSSFSFRSFCIRRAGITLFSFYPNSTEYKKLLPSPPTRRSPSSFESDDDTPGKAGWCNNEYRRRDLPLIFIYVARISDRQPPSRHLLFFSLVAVLFPRVSTIVRGFSRPTMPIADCFVSDSK